MGLTLDMEAGQRESAREGQAHSDLSARELGHQRKHNRTSMVGRTPASWRLVPQGRSHRTSLAEA